MLLIKINYFLFLYFIVYHKSFYKEFKHVNSTTITIHINYTKKKLK